RFKEQYRAEYILDVLRDRGVLLAVTTADIFADKLHFVYGLAEYRGPAIVSTARLDPQFYKESPNFQLLMSRLVKEAIHEIGHIFGLSHCQYPECVMSYSNNVKFVDKKKKWFCDSCKVKMSTEGIDLC
ncbi:MAG: archemetzincin, partial [Candidatus Aenigmatarchaeota archaeon]